jgi:LPS sulfotransferase NodH
MLNQCKSRSYLWPLITKHDVKVILVTRRNVLKTLVSRRAAAATGVYHVSASLPAKTAVANWVASPVSIDSSTIIQDLDKIAGESVEWRGRLEHLDFMELIYEQYVQDQPSWNAKVLDFLKVSRRTLNSDLKKVNPDILRNLVANYDEIDAVVRRSSYSYCLDSDD